MNKIIKIILWTLLIVVVALIFFLGITAYQIWHLKVVAEKNKRLIENDAASLINGDCTKVDSIKQHVADVENEINSACGNPLISFAVDNYAQMPLKCFDKNSIALMIEPVLTQVKQLCSNQTLMNEARARHGSNVTATQIDSYLQPYQPQLP